MSSTLNKSVVTNSAPPTGANLQPRYPNGLSGLQKGSTTLGTVTPSNGGAIVSGTQVVATMKKYGPALTETQGNLVSTVQHAATLLVSDGSTSGVQADESNHIKNSQNYGPGETKHAIESPGTGQNGTSGQVGQGGATFGQPAGYSIKGD